uniref:Uncharacterized protein n=1 Tax=Candidatus Kentrum sp. LPFa TaxID=2126335 RepID=A0A450WWP9_9GAMM|nr:MAG: hypothetical protein BECKLPF1236B_GA0070989_12566 [Candidatus Kentron sp. LPFa]
MTEICIRCDKEIRGEPKINSWGDPMCAWCFPLHDRILRVLEITDLACESDYYGEFWGPDDEEPSELFFTVCGEEGAHGPLEAEWIKWLNGFELEAVEEELLDRGYDLPEGAGYNRTLPLQPGQRFANALRRWHFDAYPKIARLVRHP